MDDIRRQDLQLYLKELFAPGRIILNRFPFMAAPAHLIQLIAQQGGGVAIPAGNINRRTKLLVAADVDSMSGKAEKARQYGIPIVGEQALRTLLAPRKRA